MKEHLQLLRKELELALKGLDAGQTQLRPSANTEKWSIQQIVGHLLKTHAATETAFDSRLAKGEPTKAGVTIAQRVGQFAVLRAGYFPGGRVAPEIVCAPSGEESLSAVALVALITGSLSTMDAKLSAAEAIFGPHRRSVKHMVLGPLNIDQWAKFHLVHGRHHIKQIVAIRRQHGV